MSWEEGYKQYLNDFEHIQKTLVKELGCEKYKHSLERIKQYLDGLFSMTKFKEGDKVVFIEDIPKKEDGWSGCYHFLIKGNTGNITAVDFRKNSFIYSVIPDNQTFYSQLDKCYEKLSRPYNFWMTEKYFEKVEE